MKFKVVRNVHVPAFTSADGNGLANKLLEMKKIVERPVRAGLPRKIAFDAVQSVTYLRRVVEMLERADRPAYYNMMVEAEGSLVPALRMEPHLMPAIKAMGEPDSGNVMADAEYLRKRGLRLAYNESLLLAVPLLRDVKAFPSEKGEFCVMPGSMLVERILVLNFSPELLERAFERGARALAAEMGTSKEDARKSLLEWWKIRTENGNRQMV
jgi:hypothetical protein